MTTSYLLLRSFLSQIAFCSALSGWKTFLLKACVLLSVGTLTFYTDSLSLAMEVALTMKCDTFNPGQHHLHIPSKGASVNQALGKSHVETIVTCAKSTCQLALNIAT